MLKKVTLRCVCILVNILAVSLHPSRPRLPQCTQATTDNNKIDLTCAVVKGQFLDYNDVRGFTHGRTDGTKFNVTITCDEGAIVQLPWPFSAKNVISLQVYGCETVGFISEMFDEYPHANEIQQMSVVDVKHRVTIKELYDSFFKHDAVPAAYDCGLSGAVSQVFRNTQYSFPPPTGSIEEIIMLEELMSSNSMEKLLSHNSVCKSPYLEYLEESGNKAFSPVRFKIMESTIQYPKLKHYVLRNNSLSTVPKELRNLNIAFLPAIEVLDLSDNAITALKFLFNGRNMKPLLVDLRRNNIRSMDDNVLYGLIKRGNIILDIRENPLDCSCNLFKYANFLLPRKITSATAKEILIGLTCEIQSDGVRAVHRLTDANLGRRLCGSA